MPFTPGSEEQQMPRGGCESKPGPPPKGLLGYGMPKGQGAGLGPLGCGGPQNWVCDKGQVVGWAWLVI